MVFSVLAIKAVGHRLISTNDVRFGLVKTDVIKMPEILAVREHFVLIDAEPFSEFRLSRRRQIRLASLLYE